MLPSVAPRQAAAPLARWQRPPRRGQRSPPHRSPGFGTALEAAKKKGAGRAEKPVDYAGLRRKSEAYIEYKAAKMDYTKGLIKLAKIMEGLKKSGLL